MDVLELVGGKNPATSDNAGDRGTASFVLEKVNQLLRAMINYRHVRGRKSTNSAAICSATLPAVGCFATECYDLSIQTVL